MNKDNYVDKMANMVILGNLLRDPAILEKKEKYDINIKDFGDNRMHMICFGSLNNLYVQGLKSIGSIDIFSYLEKNKPEHAIYFEKEGGANFLGLCMKTAGENEDKFDYYYNRMKKLSLLRVFIGYNMDVSFIYNPNVLTPEEKAYQEDKFNNLTLDGIVKEMEDMIDRAGADFKYAGGQKALRMGDNIFNFLENIDSTDSIGLPLPFGIFNSIVAGARLGKFYLMSAATGMGKSRQMMAMMLYLSCSKYYDTHLNEWVELHSKEPSLFISTELNESELSFMALAFISGVNERKINGKEIATTEERERIMEAAKVISEAEFYTEVLPDFSVDDIERCIKVNIEKANIKYCAFDYINTSIKILSEISQQTKGVKIREDSVLFMLATKLKDLANIYDVFLVSGTQLNALADGEDDAHPGMLRGSRAMADKVDYGEIMTRVKTKDKEALNTIKGQLPPETRELVAQFPPNRIKNVFKNRGDEISSGKIWCHADIGTSQFMPLFYTTNEYEIQTINKLVQELVEEEEEREGSDDR